MRIAILLEQVLAPVPGGTGRYSLELARALAAVASSRRDRDDSVSSWTAWHRDSSPARLTAVSGPHRLPVPRRGLIAAWQRGIGPRPGRADLVHAPTLLVPPRPRSGQKLVVTIHDAVPWTFPETLTPRGVLFHRQMAARAADYADAVTVPTRAVALALVEHVEGLTADRIVVTGAGVSSSLSVLPGPDFSDEVVRRLGLPERFVLSLATLEPRKGLDVLLEAMAQSGTDLPLLLVGQPGWGGIDVAVMAAQVGLAPEQVRRLGRINDGELGVVLRRATLLCAPSRAEGFGLPIAEAMTVGTPVIYSDDPAQVEVAGDAAIVVPRGDSSSLGAAISRLAADDELRAELAAAGLARSKEFDWATVAERTWTLYHRLARR